MLSLYIINTVFTSLTICAGLDAKFNSLLIFISKMINYWILLCEPKGAVKINRSIWEIATKIKNL